ncbi:hypothetical protein [Lysobacter sp. FW306-1B-D06B]|uniref:hypothetical protein n=1 Tax=Lysobacter sp. FW306-1B-D06B TaxID=3140250 RepID=UPI003140BEB5
MTKAAAMRASMLRWLLLVPSVAAGCVIAGGLVWLGYALLQKACPAASRLVLTPQIGGPVEVCTAPWFSTAESSFRLGALILIVVVGSAAAYVTAPARKGASCLLVGLAMAACLFALTVHPL